MPMKRNHMKQLPEQIDNLLIQRLEGNLNAEDAAQLDSWIAESKEHADYAEQQEELWFSSVRQRDLSKYDATKAFERFRQRIVDEEQNTESYRRSSSWPITRWIRYAAIIVAIAMVGYLSYNQGEQQLASAFADVVIEAPEGSRIKTTLPDGTEVWLNAASRMVYSQGFGLKDRNVHLIGEGYFKVKHNEELPFSVHTTNLQVNDLGTEFNLCDYPDDPEAVVTLMEGKVNFTTKTDANKVYDMNPDQRAVYNKSTGLVDIYTSTEGDASTWLSGSIVLNGQPLEEIVRLLERCYNIKIEVKNPAVLSNRFYGDFDRNTQSLTEILDALAATGRLRYTINGKVITLY